jgi:methyl-accepting chemotaxis protein
MTPHPTLRAFRWHLALTAAVVTAVFSFVAAATLFVPLFSYLASGEFSQDELGGIASYVLHLHESFWPVVAGALTASVASGMVLFERMRAPLVRFLRVYDELAAGRFPRPLELRGRDYLRSEAAALNRMVDALRERNAEAQHELERLREVLAEARPEDASSKWEGSLDEASASVEALQRILVAPT